MDNMAASDLEIMETSMMSHSSNVSGPGGLSMREKSQLKRRINKEHNSNFRAGYVPVNEEYLHKAGIRGRKRFLLYACVAVLLVLAVLNTALTAWLLWIYQISHTGMRPMEFARSSAGTLLRILDEARFDSLMLKGVYLASRHGRNLTFTGVNSKLKMMSSSMGNSSMVEVDKDVIRFSTDDLELMTMSGRPYFSLADKKISGLKNVINLHANELETRQVKNVPDYDQLIIETWNSVNITGGQGVTAMSGSVADITARNVHMASVNGSIILDGHVGMYISTGLPTVDPSLPINPDLTNSKICVCASSGRVFAVPVNKPGVGCGSANEFVNPCQA